ncbi:MAG: asparagine synthase (glutamine-hydrolyzing) [Gammaproteobacteria bacterium]
MCGIVGYINNTKLDDKAVIQRMVDALVHRGPDDSGYWISDNHNVVLCHRRLSILDLSAEGHQPMQSACGRYVIVFNGEVYNFAELRSELEKLNHKFRGHSDTEIMLAAISQWGLQNAVKRFNGMFAFALWDKKEKLLHLVRDRAGIKPLYYGWHNGTFLFSSELKALRLHPHFNTTIDRDALALYFQYGYVPAPYSIYKNIYKLLPGTILTIKSREKNFLTDPISYWSALEVAQQPRLDISKQDAIQQLQQILNDSVKLRMIADVPLGAFLSGGIDSSLITAVMQSQSSKPVKTFSIGFTEDQYNEAQHAKLVAQHLKTEHTELYVSPEDAMKVVPKLPSLYDEPFADSSQIPTFLVSQLARQNVTVSLSGDGGDELFGGYNRYFLGKNIWDKIKFCPLPVRKLFAVGLRSISPQNWDKIFSSLTCILPKKLMVQLPGDKLHKLANVLAEQNPGMLYQKLISLWDTPLDLVKDSNLQDSLYDNSKGLRDFTEQIMFWDLIHYLPDDILTKVDRASMGVSLEARVPLLDHRLIEFAWQLPLSMKIRDNQGKWLLREILYQYVPKELIERPKMGFGVPIDSWLRGSLKDWAENLINEDRLLQESYLNPEPIMRKWREHLSGKRNWQHHLWAVLMFQLWLNKHV